MGEWFLFNDSVRDRLRRSVVFSNGLPELRTQLFPILRQKAADTERDKVMQSVILYAKIRQVFKKPKLFEQVFPLVRRSEASVSHILIERCAFMEKE